MFIPLLFFNSVKFVGLSKNVKELFEEFQNMYNDPAKRNVCNNKPGNFWVTSAVYYTIKKKYPKKMFNNKKELL